MSRLKNNLEILKKLEQYIRKYPDMRFGQALENLGLVKYHIDMKNETNYWESEFYTESSELLKRLKNE